MPEKRNSEWNTCYYIDCMDKEKGMPSFQDNFFELGYTDPVWGSNMKPNEREFRGSILKTDKHKVHFNDKFDPDWTLKWFYEFERICEKNVLIIPNKLKYWFIRNTDPVADIPVLWKNGFSSGKVSIASRTSTYLFYGKFKKKNKLLYDYIAEKVYTKEHRFIVPYTLKWGFASEEKKEMIHPSPKGITVAMNVLSQLKPETLLDPFAGSGSFLQAANNLGIKWMGFEINPVYEHDLKIRKSKKTVLDWLN